MSYRTAFRPLVLRLCSLAAAGVISLSVSGGAQAIEVEDFDVENARELYELCSVPAEDALYAEAILLCYGYFTGAIHYHRSVTGPEMPAIVCPPESATTKDMVEAFVGWAAMRVGDAEIMDGPPIRAGLQAAMDTWPCE